LLQTIGVPALFVVLWSTGFIGARLGLPHAEPLTFLALRYGLAAGLLVLVALATRAPWPKRAAEIGHYAVAGLLVHGVYLGGVFVGISLDVEAGVSALIVGLQPLLTAALAGLLLGERVTARQWMGLGVGLLGVGLVLSVKLGEGAGSALGSLACVAALLGITAGTLYQKRFCAGMDLRTGSVVQFVAAGIVTAPLAFFLETMKIEWTGEFVFALLWLVVVLSLGAISLPRSAVHGLDRLAALRRDAGVRRPARDGPHRNRSGAGDTPASAAAIVANVEAPFVTADPQEYFLI
jgi:drug/metabolite transporter (DMT)-like permease